MTAQIKPFVGWKILVAGLCFIGGNLSAATFGNFIYTDDGTSVMITGALTEPVGVLNIPAKIKGMAVTGIGGNAFANCSALTSVVIPDSVTSLASYAFANCSKLARAVFLGAPSVESTAFIGAGLTTPDSSGLPLLQVCYTSSVPSVSNGGNVSYTQIGWSAPNDKFIYTGGGTGVAILGALTEPVGVVNIPATINGMPVTGIGDFAFANCSELTSVVIPDSVTWIGREAFANCSKMARAVFLGSAPSADPSVFLNSGVSTVDMYGNPALSLQVCYTSSVPSVSNGGNVSYTQIGWVSPNDQFLYTDNGTSVTILGALTEPVGVVTIPATINGKPVSSIGMHAFDGASELTSVIVPASVTSLQDYAFANCSKLSRMVFLAMPLRWATEFLVERQAGSQYITTTPLQDSPHHFGMDILPQV